MRTDFVQIWTSKVENLIDPIFSYSNFDVEIYVKSGQDPPDFHLISTSKQGRNPVGNFPWIVWIRNGHKNMAKMSIKPISTKLWSRILVEIQSNIFSNCSLKIDVKIRSTSCRNTISDYFYHISTTIRPDFDQIWTSKSGRKFAWPDFDLIAVSTFGGNPVENFAWIVWIRNGRRNLVEMLIEQISIKLWSRSPVEDFFKLFIKNRHHVVEIRSKVFRPLLPDFDHSLTTFRPQFDRIPTFRRQNLVKN